MTTVASQGMDKRKVACFLLLVVVGLACLAAMLYALFYARPRADEEIRQGGRSAVCLPYSPVPYLRNGNEVRSPVRS